ncbi:hypothetical protein RFI_12809 [Reticulomyxa filosa]|uniref:Uncharacterized protein n=1 Tax=Reticulomyxa filosa TaxID=46433 RepID=X6NF17_RETFI|nr:hypothetical protein RFI_12809 [Reticulomyxa filosa]|eukprot:ETO24349.1 hypothetical protein RFI_12809 [Reticulomyxa filosa]
MRQLKSNEKIKEKYEITILARFAHCVSFTILRLSHEFIQSYWDEQLQNLQKPFGISNKQLSQTYFQTIFQEQFKSSLLQLCEKGKEYIHSELKKEIIKENSCFQYLFDEIENKIDIIKKNVLIESCLRSMWSCLLSRPSLKPYPLIFTSNPQLNQEIQSKKPEITKEFLGKESGCNDIGYFTWPSLIRCDTNDLLNVPIAACYASFHVIVSNGIIICHIMSKDQKESKIEQFKISHVLEEWIGQYNKMRETRSSVLIRFYCFSYTIFEICYFL